MQKIATYQQTIAGQIMQYNDFDVLKQPPAFISTINNRAGYFN